ncbi:MAG: hypothetical protein AAB465_01030 [Patescibacteria group bacterium]
MTKYYQGNGGLKSNFLGLSNSFYKKINLLFIGFFVIFLGVYLFQTNRIASAGYVARGLDWRTKELTEDNQSIIVELSQAKSIENIALAAQKLNLVEAKAFDYIKGGITAVAQNKPH